MGVETQNQSQTTYPIAIRLILAIKSYFKPLEKEGKLKLYRKRC